MDAAVNHINLCARSIRAENGEKRGNVVNLDDHRWKEPDIAPVSRVEQIKERLKEIDDEAAKRIDEELSLLRELSDLGGSRE